VRQEPVPQDRRTRGSSVLLDCATRPSGSAPFIAADTNGFLIGIVEPIPPGAAGDGVD